MKGLWVISSWLPVISADVRGAQTLQLLDEAQLKKNKGEGWVSWDNGQAFPVL